MCGSEATSEEVVDPCGNEGDEKRTEDGNEGERVCGKKNECL